MTLIMWFKNLNDVLALKLVSSDELRFIEEEYQKMLDKIVLGVH